MQVTDRALDKLEEMRDATDAKPEEGIALVLAEAGKIEMTLGVPGANDQVFRREEKPIIIITEGLEQPLDGMVFDYVESAEGQGGFTLAQPEAEAPSD